jgi:cystinosin
VILDLTGGVLSMVQIFLNALALGEPVIGGGGFNVVKFILSVMSIIFDCIFLFQHYVLYSDAWKKDAKKKKLEES